MKGNYSVKRGNNMKSMEELKEQIAQVIYSTCPYIDDFMTGKTEDWEVSKSYLKEADQILTLFQNWLRQAGYVQLDDDQSLPINPYKLGIVAYSKQYDYAQQDMLKAGFKKVK